VKPLTKHVTVTCETYTIVLFAHKVANSRLTGSLRARQDSETTAIGSFNREFKRLYRAKESVAHKREGAAYACLR